MDSVPILKYQDEIANKEINKEIVNQRLLMDYRMSKSLETSGFFRNGETDDDGDHTYCRTKIEHEKKKRKELELKVIEQVL